MGRESCLPNQFTDRAEFLTPLARIGWQAKACPTSAACRHFTLVVHCQAVASSRKIGLILTPMHGPRGSPWTRPLASFFSVQTRSSPPPRRPSLHLRPSRRHPRLVHV